MKPIFRIIPLIYFIGLSLFWAVENYMTTGTINYIAIIVGLVLVAQLFFKNNIARLATGILAGVVSFYMLIGLLYYLQDEIEAGNGRIIVIQIIMYSITLLMAATLIIYDTIEISRSQNRIS